MTYAFDSKALELAREAQASIDSTEAGPMPAARRVAIIQTAIVAGMHWASEAASRLQAPAVAEVEKALDNAEKAVRAQSSPEWLQGMKGGYWEGYRDAIEDAAEDVAALRTGGSE